MSLLGLFQKSLDGIDGKGRVLGAEDLRLKLLTYMPIRSVVQTYLRLSDGGYRLLPWPLFSEVMDRCRGERLKYRDDIYDCDDFADGFCVDVRRQWARLSTPNIPLAFGSVRARLAESGNVHRFIWHLDESGLRYIEPQTDGIFRPAITAVLEVTA